MNLIQVGAPYPERLVLRDAMVTMPLPGGGLVSLVHLSRFEEGDLEAFKGEMVVAVAVAEDIPFLALSFPATGVVLDGPLLVGGTRTASRAALEVSGNTLQVVFLEGPQRIVRHIRLVGLSPEVVEALRAPALRQTRDEIALRRMLARAQQALSSSEAVVAAAAAKQRFPRSNDEAPPARSEELREAARLLRRVPGYVPGRRYPEPLPEEIAPWYLYTADGGHSVLAVLGQDAGERDVRDYLVPVPVRTVLRAYRLEELPRSRPTGRYVVALAPEARYDEDLGLIVPPEDEEF